MPILFTDRSRQAQGGRAKSRAMSRTSHILQDQSHPAGPVTSSRTSHIQQDQSHSAGPVTSSRTSHIQQIPSHIQQIQSHSAGLSHIFSCSHSPYNTCMQLCIHSHLLTVIHSSNQHLESRRAKGNINSINALRLHFHIQFGEKVAEDTLQSVSKILKEACTGN